MKTQTIANENINLFSFTITKQEVLNNLETISSICTMKTLSQLLGTTYTSYIDDLRHTYGQNLKADQLTSVINTLENELEELETVRAERNCLRNELSDILLTEEERIELEHDYYNAVTDTDYHQDQADTLRKHYADTIGTTYTDLKDLFQQFALCYLSAEPTDKDLEKTLDKISDNVEYLTLDEEQQNFIVNHITRIILAKRGVNKYIRQQANKTADYNKKLTSYELQTTDEDGQPITRTVRTANLYTDSYMDVERIRALYKNANLNTSQRRFLELFCSKDALHVEQIARSEYHAENYNKMLKRGEKSIFNQRLSNFGYNARKKFVLEKIGILSPAGQSKFMARLTDKLQSQYDSIAQIDDNKAQPQPQKVIKHKGLNRPPRKAQPKQTQKVKKNIRPFDMTIKLLDKSELEKQQNTKSQTQQAEYLLTPIPSIEPLLVDWLRAKDNHTPTKWRSIVAPKEHKEHPKKKLAIVIPEHIKNPNAKRKHPNYNTEDLQKMGHNEPQPTNYNPLNIIGKTHKIK